MVHCVEARSSATAKSTARPLCLLYFMTFIGRSTANQPLLRHPPRN